MFLKKRQKRSVYLYVLERWETGGQACPGGAGDCWSPQFSLCHSVPLVSLGDCCHFAPSLPNLAPTPSSLPPSIPTQVFALSDYPTGPLGSSAHHHSPPPQWVHLLASGVQWNRPVVMPCQTVLSVERVDARVHEEPTKSFPSSFLCLHATVLGPTRPLAHPPPAPMPLCHPEHSIHLAAVWIPALHFGKTTPLPSSPLPQHSVGGKLTLPWPPTHTHPYTLWFLLSQHCFAFVVFFLYIFWKKKKKKTTTWRTLGEEQQNLINNGSLRCSPAFSWWPSWP